jgi:hypothetical protein
MGARIGRRLLQSAFHHASSSNRFGSHRSDGRGRLWQHERTNADDVVVSARRIGPETTDLSAPSCCLGTIIDAYGDVTFADSLTGKAVVDTDSIVTVFAGPVPFNGYYDYFTLTGKITNGRYAGRWKQQVDPHGRTNVGSFVTVP